MDSDSSETSNSCGHGTIEKKLTDYEKVREMRIAQNNEKIKALNLPRLVNSLTDSRVQRIMSSKVVDTDSDVDYEPDSDDDSDDDSSDSIPFDDDSDHNDFGCYKKV